MEEIFRPPFLKYDDIAVKAEAFLRKYHQSSTLPVDIERIVEKDLRLDIVPIPGLHQSHDISGFLSGDLSQIWIEQSLLENYPGRYRFTLAHEVGHMVLHADVYTGSNHLRLQEYMKFLKRFAHEDILRFDSSANNFAGLVLVPRKNLEREFEQETTHIPDHVSLTPDNWDEISGYIAAQLARRFEVSQEVVRIRVEKDGLKDKYLS